MKVGFLQTSPLFGKKDENIDKATTTIQSLKTDLLVLTELYNTGYQFTSRKEACISLPGWLNRKMGIVITRPSW